MKVSNPRAIIWALFFALQTDVASRNGLRFLGFACGVISFVFIAKLILGSLQENS